MWRENAIFWRLLLPRYMITITHHSNYTSWLLVGDKTEQINWGKAYKTHFPNKKKIRFVKKCHVKEWWTVLSIKPVRAGKLLD